MVYDALKAVEGMKPKKPQWEIAQELKIVEAKMWVRKTDTPAEAADKKNVLTAIVGRYKKRVSKAIKSAGMGKFPSQNN
jgi:ribosome-binding protein aMBF1 (putative translation factor)